MTSTAPPLTMPQELSARNTMDGLADVYDWYFNESYPPGQPRRYDVNTFAQISGYVSDIPPERMICIPQKGASAYAVS